jgi:hypothetical protein
MEQRNAKLSKLEKVAKWVSYGSIAMGVGVGGIASYVTRNPTYVIFGPAIGATVALISVAAFTIYQQNLGNEQ